MGKYSEPRVSELHALAMGYSVHRELCWDDAQDCAMEFVLHMLEGERRETLARLTPAQAGAWLHRCARNHVADFCRADRSRRRREYARVEPEYVSTDPRALAQAHLLALAFWQGMLVVLARLPEETQELLVRHHVGGEAVDSIARDQGRTTHAVEQALLRARRRLRDQCVRTGLDETSLRALLCAAS